MSAVANLESLARDINQEHAAALAHAETAVEHARRAGELLAKAKETIAHGRWLEWLVDHCDVSERQAQRYMRLAANPTRVSYSMAAALAELCKPRELTAIARERPVETNNAIADCRRISPAANDKSVTTVRRELEEGAEFPHFTPQHIPERFRDFHRKQADADDNILRLVNRIKADFHTHCDGLNRFEKNSAWNSLCTLFGKNLFELDISTGIPIEPGHVTLGEIGEAAVFVLLESRQHRGYWHDIDLRGGNASRRPVKPLGLRWRLAGSIETAACRWRTAPDDGSFLALVERAA